METSVLNQVVVGLLGVLQIVVIYAAKKGLEYLEARKANEIADKGAKDYNDKYKKAMDIYYIAEEAFKFIPQSGLLKKDMFDSLIIKAIPGITEDEIEHFRQTVVGYINSEVKNSGLLNPAPEFDPSVDSADVKGTPDPDPAAVTSDQTDQPPVDQPVQTTV